MLYFRLSSMRDKQFDLPDYEELQKILQQEAVRPIISEKTDAHYVDFSSIIAFCEIQWISTDYFTKRNSREDLENPQFRHDLKTVETWCLEAVADFSWDRNLVDNMWDYLCEEDTVSPADLIIVFWAPWILRIQKAVELYKQWSAQKILISGKWPIRGSDEISEAERLKAYAMENGIPEPAIITEDKSISIPDNIKSSLNLLDNISYHPQSIILISSPYALRRTYAYAKKFMDDTVQIYRVASGSKFTKEKWFTTAEGAKAVVNEYMKMKVSLLLNTV